MDQNDFSVDIFREIAYCKAHLNTCIHDCFNVVQSPSVKDHLRVLFGYIATYDFFTSANIDDDSAD